MNARALECVVDASVGAMLFLPEPLSPKAHKLFESLAASPPGRLFVPDLFYAECANVLLKYVRRGGYSVREARRDLADLRSLSLMAVPTSELVDRAMSIADAEGISAYDACYVALADEIGAPLITADLKLVRKLADTAHQVRALG
ncbi:MAG TPA: type II toxin-antitoxin system VapC family toxin [Phycisphaerae bacterium]|nr:type II toxin-antitoxin system VapC family toxin [Phycisphaerae bacterium]